MEAPDQARWFSEEVHAHEASLRAYVRGSFPTVRDVDDVVQESFLRVWRARLGRPIASSKRFLFIVARHVVLDSIRRARKSPIDSFVDSAGLHVVESRPSVADVLSDQEKIDLLGRAVGALPARCREIIILHKIMGRSQREVAGELGVCEKTVENQVARGVQHCKDFFRQHGIEYF
mgnify:CR=1 FL=1